MKPLFADIWLTYGDASSLAVLAASAHIIDDAVPRATLPLHDASPLPSRGHQKRMSGSRRINDCSNPPSHFFSSYCKGVDYQIRSPNPLSVQVFCNDSTPTRNWTDPTPNYRYKTFCRDDEICVTQQGVHNPWLEGTQVAAMAGDSLVDVAWCVGRGQFVAIAQSQLKHMTKPDTVAAPYQPIDKKNKAQNVSVQATLVSEHRRAFINRQNDDRSSSTRPCKWTAAMAYADRWSQLLQPLLEAGAEKCAVAHAWDLGTTFLAVRGAECAAVSFETRHLARVAFGWGLRPRPARSNSVPRDLIVLDAGKHIRINSTISGYDESLPVRDLAFGKYKLLCLAHNGAATG